MIDADDLVQGVLRGVLGGRRKRSGRALRYLSRGSRGVLAPEHVDAADHGQGPGLLAAVTDPAGQRHRRRQRGKDRQQRVQRKAGGNDVARTLHPWDSNQQVTRWP